LLRRDPLTIAASKAVTSTNNEIVKAVVIVFLVEVA
jgi:hypothetical protein